MPATVVFHILGVNEIVSGVNVKKINISGMLFAFSKVGPNNFFHHKKNSIFMKQKLLLFIACLCAITTDAQESTSLMFSRQLSPARGVPLSTAEMNRMQEFYATKKAPSGAAKTTLGPAPHDDWYNMWGQNFTSGTSAGFYFACFPDSNVIDNTSTPYNIYTHGMGMSFDPYDSAYFSFVVNGGALVTPVSAAMIPGQPYIIDSFFTPVRYMRNDPNIAIVDSLVFEFVITQTTAVLGSATDSGAYSLKVTTASTSFLPVCFDETPRWGTLHYNGGYGNFYGLPYTQPPYINDCYFDSVFTLKWRYVVPMTDGNKNDTDLLGNWNICQTCTPHMATLPLLPVVGAPSFALSGNLRQHMVTFVSFKSGHSGATYPLNTLGSTANWIKLFAGEPAGSTTWWMQSSGNGGGYLGSYQQGLIAQDQVRYNDTGFCVLANARHNTLIPAFAFSAPPGFDVTEQSFHIKWIGVPLGVADINSNSVSQVSAYPNPATGELTISYTTAQTAPVTVSLINTLGQVVATKTVTNGKAVFNTAKLAGGVYIYSIDVNDTHESGRVLIQH
jgi:Secretion system C-terminal sorting domain